MGAVEAGSGTGLGSREFTGYCNLHSLREISVKREREITAITYQNQYHASRLYQVVKSECRSDCAESHQLQDNSTHLELQNI